MSYEWNNGTAAIGVIYSTADSRNMYRPVIVSLEMYNGGYVPAPPPSPQESRCRYCDTKAFEGERRCVACGAPL